VKSENNPGGYKDFSFLELKELKGKCGKEQTLRISTNDLVELGFRLKKGITQIVSKQLKIEDFVHELWRADSPSLASGLN